MDQREIFSRLLVENCPFKLKEYKKNSPRCLSCDLKVELMVFRVHRCLSILSTVPGAINKIKKKSPKIERRIPIIIRNVMSPVSNTSVPR